MKLQENFFEKSVVFVDFPPGARVRPMDKKYCPQGRNLNGIQIKNEQSMVIVHW